MSNLHEVYELMLDTQVSTSIADRAKKYRKRLKMSRAELALRAGLHEKTIAKFENTGRTSLDTLIKISRVLGDIDSLKNIFKDRPIKTWKDIEEDYKR